MARGDDKLLRQLSLVSFLLSRSRPVTAHEIAQSVEGYANMSVSTFTRRFHMDREELSRSGIVIEVHDDDDRDLYHLPPENFYLPDLELTSEEERALAAALVLLEGSFPYVRPLRLALSTLMAATPGDPLDPASLGLALPPDEDARDRGPQFARLEDAVARHKSVRFGYYSAHREAESTRSLDPYGLFRIGGHWYVVGRDHEHDGERMFRLSRIRGTVEFASKKPRDFEVPDSYDPGRYRSRPSWLLDSPVGTVTLRADASLGWWLARTYPEAVRAGGEEAEGELFEVPYADRDALLSWILQLGPKVEVVAPPELRQEVIRMVRRVLDVHPISPEPK